MREREHYQLATTVSETMYALLEAEYQQGQRDVDAMLMRLKDLSAYSLTHAEIMEPREGVELLALARFFGMTSDPRFHHNQQRLQLVSDEAIEYQGRQGRAEAIEQERAARQAHEAQQENARESEAVQPRLL